MSLPSPTPTRLKLADAIDTGQVRHYNWTKPRAIDTSQDLLVTARVGELVKAKIAAIPAVPFGSYAIVQLTDAGREWRAKARAS